MRALLPLLALWVLARAPLWAMQGPAQTAKPAAPRHSRRPQGSSDPGPSRAAAGPPTTTRTSRAAGAIRSSICSSTGNEPRAVSRRGEGVAGLAVADVSVRGVLQSAGMFYAMVQGPDGKTYMMHRATSCSTAR